MLMANAYCWCAFDLVVELRSVVCIGEKALKYSKVVHDSYEESFA